MKQSATIIWLDQDTLTASFHAVKGFVKYVSADLPKFREMLQRLVDLGVRFQ